MIPSCLKLQDKQSEKFERFLNFVTSKIGEEEDLIEDCCMASPFTFEMYATGIGDIITVRGLGYFCDLSVDDDGEISNDEWGK